MLTILANNNLLLKRAGCVCHHSIVGKRSVNETLSWTYDHMQRMIRRLRDISTILSCNRIITTRYASVSDQLVRRRSIVKCLSINLNNLLECFSVSDIVISLGRHPSKKDHPFDVWHRQYPAFRLYVLFHIVLIKTRLGNHSATNI